MTDIFVYAFVDPAGLDRLRSLEKVRVDVTPIDDEPIGWTAPGRSHGAQIHMWTFPPRNFQDFKSLEMLQITSTGYTQLFDLGLVEKRIRAANARGVFDKTIAEWNVAMMVNLARDLRGMIRNQEAGLWERRPLHQMEISRSVVGLWGYGGIGRETARLCKAIGMQVHVLTRHGARPRKGIYCVPGTGDPEGVLPDRVFLVDRKDEFLSSLDFLILSLPLTKQTEGLVGEEELRDLPEHAFLLNPARGPLVQEEALLQALREGWIAGAALDTHHYYPMPADHPLWRFPNVIMTPHISGSIQSPYYRERLWDIFVENVVRYMSGRPLLNELSREQLKGD